MIFQKDGCSFQPEMNYIQMTYNFEIKWKILEDRQL